MEERRRTQRVKDKAAITIKLADSGDELAGCKIVQEISKDLSLSGCRIQCHTFIPVNTLLRIESSLRKTGRVITALGRVRWVKSVYGDELYEMGIEFVEASPEVIRILEDYIKESIVD